MERPSVAEDVAPIDAEAARAALTSTDVARLGRRADARRRAAHGDVARYGPAPSDGRSATATGHVELLAGDDVLGPDDVSDEGADDGASDVDAVVAGPEWTVDDHEALHEAGAATDATVLYGEDEDLVGALGRLRALARRTEGLRTVCLRPADERSTAYDDLRAVAVARLFLDDPVHVRIDRGAVGEKCCQTALAYGVDDVGFAGDHGFDTELLIREAGDEPRIRGGSADG